MFEPSEKPLVSGLGSDSTWLETIQTDRFNLLKGSFFKTLEIYICYNFNFGLFFNSIKRRSVKFNEDLLKLFYYLKKLRNLSWIKGHSYSKHGENPSYSIFLANLSLSLDFTIFLRYPKEIANKKQQKNFLKWLYKN